MDFKGLEVQLARSFYRFQSLEVFFHHGNQVHKFYPEIKKEACLSKCAVSLIEAYNDILIVLSFFNSFDNYIFRLIL